MYDTVQLNRFTLFYISVWSLIRKNARCSNLGFKSAGQFESLSKCVAYCKTNSWRYFVYGYCNQDTCACIYYIDQGRDCSVAPWNGIDLYKVL